MGLPAGTVTFLLTDIEDSSSQWERDADVMRARLDLHDSLIREAVEGHGGTVVKHMGDGCWAAFPTAPSAADAAVAFRRRLDAEPDEVRSWLRVRIGLHTGDVEPSGDDYFGPVPNRSARIADLANGNQIVCSSATAGLLDGHELRSEGLHELKGIGTDEVFTLVVDGIIADDRPLRRPVSTHDLPRVHTSFVGREAERKVLADLLAEDHAVITLVGPGGVGKTRLALEAVQEVAAETDAVTFCDLAPAADGETLVEAVAEAVGARRQSGMTLAESIVDYWGDRPALLILDNCEHLTEAVARLIETLDRAPAVTLLATSREALHVAGEQALIVEPLDPDEGAFELFIQRAKERDSSFDLDAGEEASVREIVRRLDGIPLAIELAAARTRILRPADLAARLDHRFAVLGGDHVERDRHETLHAAVSWSHRLLSPAEAALFDRLSVFSGGFGLEAVEAICTDDELVQAPDVPELLLGLIDKSMVKSVSQRHVTRFELLETLRSFGHEHLSDDDARRFRRRHADHYLRVAVSQNERMFSDAEQDAWAVLAREWANLRAALDCFEDDDDLDAGADLTVALVWFAAVSLRDELFSWAGELLEADDIETHPRFTDLCGAAALGSYLTVQGDPTAIAERGLAVDPSDPEGFCRTAMAAVLLNSLHTPEDSDAVTTAWLAAPPRTPGSRLWAEAFRTFHLCTHDPGPEAAEHAATLRRMAEETGSTTIHAVAAWAQGQVVSFTDLERAIEIWTEGLEWPRSAPDDHLVEHLITGLLLHVTARRGEISEVLHHCRSALGAAVESHYNVGISHLFGVTAIALCRVDNAEVGARLIGSMIAHGHIPRSNAQRAVEDALGDDADDHVTAGMGLSITAASHLALDALDRAIEDLRPAAA